MTFSTTTARMMATRMMRSVYSIPSLYPSVLGTEADRRRSPLPEFHHDFPGGAGRWVQGAIGYDLTLVNGEVTVEAGEHTGALPGVTLRS